VVVHSKQDRCIKILVVMYRDEATQLKAEIAESCRLDWSRYVQFRVTTQDEDKEDLTTEVIQMLKTGCEENCKVFVQGASVNKKRLAATGYEMESAKATKTLLTKIKAALRDHKLEWRAYADAEWQKSSIGHASVQQWYQQLAACGHGGIAKNLLKGLRVITQGELRDSFKEKRVKDDNIGLRCMHAYITDDEPGASSNTVCDVLSKLLNEKEICSLDLDDPNCFEGLMADLLYVYEDGLWSGVELVERLGKLSKIQNLMDSKVRIEFRYGAVADAGLAAARIAASNYPAGKFTVVSADHRFDFIRKGTDSTFPHLEDRSDESIRKAIDASVEPYIFSRPGLWGDSYPAAVEICGNIGAQLIKPYLENQARRKAQKTTMHDCVNMPGHEVDIPEIDPSKISKWKLGAEGFASTVVFQSSIPKPVLPMMWLAGTVLINGEEIDWKPLFWDSRRIGTSAPRV
jgi:hypothetical protein